MTSEIVLRESGLKDEFTIEIRWLDSPATIVCKTKFNPNITPISDLFRLAEEIKQKTRKT